eukprot:TRINITY_DN12268_c0_g1_i1.p1 TRINITY_DN12268_c0_g1~~TRINITY_DN12268_c0_g1_i1.p1  ORF type:complete len:448 (-),score=60.98 TRINITY_DN12268_c0_g1_i1:474-1763(-)
MPAHSRPVHEVNNATDVASSRGTYITNHWYFFRQDEGDVILKIEIDKRTKVLECGAILTVKVKKSREPDFPSGCVSLKTTMGEIIMILAQLDRAKARPQLDSKDLKNPTSLCKALMTILHPAAASDNDSPQPKPKSRNGSYFIDGEARESRRSAYSDNESDDAAPRNAHSDASDEEEHVEHVSVRSPTSACRKKTTPANTPSASKKTEGKSPKNDTPKKQIVIPDEVIELDSGDEELDVGARASRDADSHLLGLYFANPAELQPANGKLKVRNFDPIHRDAIKAAIKRDPFNVSTAPMVCMLAEASGLKKGSFGQDELNKYIKDGKEVIVLGGNHVRSAYQALHNEFPSKKMYSERPIVLYDKMHDDLAVHIAHEHNHANDLRKAATNLVDMLYDFRKAFDEDGKTFTPKSKAILKARYIRDRRTERIS